MKIKIINSFKFAFRGIGHIFKEQIFKIFIFISLIVIFLMFYLGVSFIEKSILILAITLVFSLELINSQVEKTLDIVEPKFNHQVGKIKDISAAAVLVASLGSFFIGLIIFLPYIISYLGF